MLVRSVRRRDELYMGRCSVRVFCTVYEDVLELVITMLVIRAACSLLICTEIVIAPAEAYDNAPFFPTAAVMFLAERWF